jgi:hypothetical protein
MAVATGNTMEDAIVLGDSSSSSSSDSGSGGGGSDGGGGGMPPLVRLEEEEEEEEQEEEEEEEEEEDATRKHPNFMVMNVKWPYSHLLVSGIKNFENRTWVGAKMVGVASGNAPPRGGLVVGIVECKNHQPLCIIRAELARVNEGFVVQGLDGIPTDLNEFPHNPGHIVGSVCFGGSQPGDICRSPWASGKPNVFAISVVPGSATRFAVPILCEGAQTPLTRFGPRRADAEIAFRKAWMAAEAAKV